MKTFICSLLILFVVMAPKIISADDKKPTSSKKQADIKKLVSKQITSIRKSDNPEIMKYDPEVLDQLLDLRIKSNIRGYENNKQFQKTDKNIRKVFSTKLKIDPKKVDGNFEKRTLEAIKGNTKSYQDFYKNHIKKDPQLKKLSQGDVIRIYVNYSATIYTHDRATWDSIWGASYIYPICEPITPDLQELNIRIKEVNTNLKNIVSK